MKYRILTLEELEVFAEDFKQFLIVNGIHAEEWEKMNKNDKEKAVQFVELFSDTVLQKVYEKISFLEFRSEQSCMIFKMNKENIELISISAKEGSGISLETPESIHSSLLKTPESLTIFKTQKKYLKEREFEVHEMLQQGCLHSDKAFWDSLEKVL